MATTVQIPVSEYLATTYQPDRDYLNGVLQERRVGTQSHSILQYLLAKWFDDRFDTYGCLGLPEQRIRVADNRYRIPDVSAMLEGGAGEEVIVSVPLACIEVLSPDDTLPGLQERVADYVAMGVPNVWIFDPVTRQVWIADVMGLQRVQTETLPVRGTELAVDLPQLFKEFERRLLRSR